MPAKPLDPKARSATTLSSASTASLRAFVVQAQASRTPVAARPLMLVGSAAGNANAAATIAKELGRPLLRIDLSAGVGGKYLAETEKGLDRAFADASRTNAVLFFDEADALFGKRTDVKDSHDRFANTEVAYLLQRIEAHQGVAIVATRASATIDPRYLSRFQAAIHLDPPT